MAVSVEQVKVLNGKIEKLNTQRTKVNAQIEILKDRLDKELSRYSLEHGVDLKGKNIRETVKKILDEQKKVASEIESEYELKSKVVSAIESGNISEANAMLGIKEEVEETEEVKSEEPEETEVAEDATSDADMVEDDFGLGIDLGDDIGELEIDDDTGDLEEEEVQNSGDKVNNLGSSVDEVVEELDLGMEDETEDDSDDFDDFGFGDLLSGTKLSVD